MMCLAVCKNDEKAWRRHGEGMSDINTIWRVIYVF
ncbi:hypothetical protein COPEUT_01502 [Coprococcus eutactus ATCC 27759]|nr:hypothetical protein COPEUT_01502 [Coprococcus eutactus ATCC 27759]